MRRHDKITGSARKSERKIRIDRCWEEWKSDRRNVAEWTRTLIRDLEA